jgi:hypothetical protein
LCMCVCVCVCVCGILSQFVLHAVRINVGKKRTANCVASTTEGGPLFCNDKTMDSSHDDGKAALFLLCSAVRKPVMNSWLRVQSLPHRRYTRWFKYDRD